MRGLTIRHLYPFSTFKFNSNHSLATNIQYCTKITHAFDLYSQYSPSFIPRTYSLFSRKLAQMLHYNDPIPSSHIHQYLHDLIQIEYSLLSIDESLGILFFGRCLGSSYGELSPQMIELMFNLFRHCGTLFLSFKYKFSSMVDFVAELNLFIEGLDLQKEQNRQFIAEMKSLKEKLYEKIQESYPTAKTEKIDLIYHLMALINEHMKEDISLIVAHQGIMRKSITDLEELLVYFTVGRLTKSINIIISELSKIQEYEDGEPIFRMLREYLETLTRQLFEKVREKSQGDQFDKQQNKIKQCMADLKARKGSIQEILLKMAISYNEVTKILKNIEKVQHHHFL